MISLFRRRSEPTLAFGAQIAGLFLSRVFLLGHVFLDDASP